MRGRARTFGAAVTRYELCCRFIFSLLVSIDVSAAEAQVAEAAVVVGDSMEYPQAQESRRYHASLYAAKWAEVNLPAFPARIVKLDVPMEPAYFVSLGFGYVLVPDFSLPLGFADLSGCDLELDGQLIKHFGLQSHVEGSLALVFRTGDANFWDALHMNFAVGEGFSLAFARPAYEKGPGGQRGVDSRRFQNHLLFELEFAAPSVAFVHFVVRLHHRSGIYGVISPQRTGSNYVGIGLRMDG